MSKKTIFIIFVIVLIVAALGLWFIMKKAVAPAPKITNFEECAAAGYPVIESYPRQCRTPNGKTFAEKVPENSPEIIPGAKSLLYQNQEFGFKLWYPEGSDVRTQGFEGFLRATSDGANVVGVFLPENLFTGTNLAEAVVAIGTNPDPDALAKCGKAADSEEKSSGTININGAEFNSFDATGVGAGNLYESKIYRTVHNGSCYEIVEMLHSGNIGNYPAGTVKEFDKPKFSGFLEKIVQTFAFIGNAASGATGIVTLGPTCPVERIPPDPSCAPKPYETAITITKDGFSRQVTSDFAGRFRVDIDPGFYQFQAKGGATLPRCSPVPVEIKARSFTWVPISCDTGIR